MQLQRFRKIVWLWRRSPKTHVLFMEVKKIKLKLPKKCIDESTIIKKEIVRSDEYNLLVEEANKKIKAYRDT